MNHRFDNSASRTILLFLGLLCISTSASTNNESANQPHTVQDPGYGQALYHYFQQNDLAAITQLLVARQQPQRHRQQDQSDLLLADLYYSYGLFSESDSLFSQLLNREMDVGLLNRLWFNLARLNHDKGDNQNALQLLLRIRGQFPHHLQDEKQHLLTNLLVLNDKIDEAAKIAQSIDSNSVWVHYARYNLALGFLQHAQTDRALDLLQQIADLDIEDRDEELLTLRDRANLTMGLSQLRDNRKDAALESLQRIRIAGPLSNTALLAAGWAWANAGQMDKALVPWLELTSKNTVDAATQEALLAIPTTLEQNQKPELALQYFTRAAQQFDRQLDILTQAQESIRNGELTSLLNQNALLYNTSAKFATSSLDSANAPYLHLLIASAEFHRELKRYRELIDIGATLNHWRFNLPTLALMLKERKQRFVEKLPLLEETSNFELLDTLRRSRQKLADQLSQVDKNDTTLALANEAEQGQLQRLERIASSIEIVSQQQDTSEEQDKYRLLRGILNWQIQTSYASRLWKAKKQLANLDEALHQATQRQQSLQQINIDSINRFDQFENRINAQQNKIGGLIDRVANLIDRQEKRINQLSIKTIEAQQEHIVQLRLNARYSLARLYDKVVND